MTKEQFATELQEQVQGGTSVSNIMHLLDQWNGGDNFKDAVKPLMKYLAENHHPHVTAIVEGNQTEILEGIE